MNPATFTPTLDYLMCLFRLLSLTGDFRQNGAFK